MALNKDFVESRTNGQKDFFTFALGAALSFTPMGYWGFIAAGFIGSFLWPPKYEKPDPYTELQLNSAQVGIPIPLVYGTCRVSGNYVWKGPLRVKSIKKSSKF